MIVQARQLEADVGCGDVYMMTATDTAVEPTQTCGWECVLPLHGNDYWFLALPDGGYEMEVHMFDEAWDYRCSMSCVE